LPDSFDPRKFLLDNAGEDKRVEALAQCQQLLQDTGEFFGVAPGNEAVQGRLWSVVTAA